MIACTVSKIINILVSPNSLSTMPRRNKMITVHDSNANGSKSTFHPSQQNTIVLLVFVACELHLDYFY